MPSSSTSTIVGWTLSVLIYMIVVTIGIYMLQSHNTKMIKYTANKKNLLNVTLVERKVKKVIKKKKKIVKKKTTVSKPKTVAKKKTLRAKPAKTKPNFKKLFGKINLDKLPKDSPKKEQKVRKKVVKKEVEEVVKEDKAKKITETLEFDKQEHLIATQNNGQYDEFRGKISDILDTNWQNTIDTVSGNVAKVIIGVDKFGSFSYKIESLSYNDAFNAKLREFLEEMRAIEFPPFREGEIFNMKVVFKDILE